MEHVSLDKPPFKYFIASLLLPCGPADGAVIKYTGNDNVGPLSKDPMMALLYAYTHFTYIYTDHQLLICDLQGKLSVTLDYTGIKWHLLGLFDKNKALCLFDPQAHTSVLFITFQPYLLISMTAMNPILLAEYIGMVDCQRCTSLFCITLSRQTVERTSFSEHLSCLSS